MKNRLVIFLLLFLPYILTAGHRDVKIYMPEDSVTFDTIPYIIMDQHYENSYRELTDMFDGKIPYNLKRAEFLVENPYYDGKISYDDFSHDIDSIVAILNQFIDVMNIRGYKTAPNYALFEYFTKPNPMNGNLSFTYDFDNITSFKSYTICFTSYLLRTHKGQCVSMPLLYKILCDELGGQSALALGPRHMYIKHIGEDGRWVNVELTHGGFVRDVWLMETMNISTEAIRNGIFLCALDKKETIALMLMQLARSYIAKYDSYDSFVERCADYVLAELPTFCDALLIKYCVHQELIIRYQNIFGEKFSPYFEEHYRERQHLLNRLDSLGYTQPTTEEYLNELEEGRQAMERKRHE